MKHVFKSVGFKITAAVIGLLLVGMFLCAANGHSESAQSTVIGTIFTPAHWIADKISDGIGKVTNSAKGNAEYDKKIDELQNRLGELQNQLSDYENLKEQNELYKDALELKEENSEFEFTEASVIGRDSANPYCTFTINKGTLNDVNDGYAVVYGKYLIGVVKKAYPTYSVVSTIIDPDFSVSAFDINTKELSYVTGDAKLAEKGSCKFEYLDSATKITYGSIITTAGISGTIPRGIVIGTVREINDEATNISTYAVIEPGTDIKKIDKCLILTNYNIESEGN